MDRPVVAEVGGPLLHLLAGRQGRQRGADPVQRALGLGRAAPSGASVAASAAAFARSVALIRSHWRFTSLAVAASASPNTCGWRRTIFVASAAWTSARSKTPASAASWAWRMTWSSRSPSSSARAGVAPAFERVVDLVRLLEQVLPQRRVGLLAVPRAAVGLAQPGADPGHGPRSRGGQLGRDRGEVAGRLEVAVGQVGDRGRRRIGRSVRRRARPDTAGAARSAARRRPGRCGRAAGRPAAAGSAAAAPARRTASGTIRTGRDASIGLPMSRSAATTWSPSAGSSPHRSRASATSASSTGPPV